MILWISEARFRSFSAITTSLLKPPPLIPDLSSVHSPVTQNHAPLRMILDTAYEYSFPSGSSLLQVPPLQIVASNTEVVIQLIVASC